MSGRTGLIGDLLGVGRKGGLFLTRFTRYSCSNPAQTPRYSRLNQGGGPPGCYSSLFLVIPGLYLPCGSCLPVPGLIGDYGPFQLRNGGITAGITVNNSGKRS